jgi:hypothetical protein
MFQKSLLPPSSGETTGRYNPEDSLVIIAAVITSDPAVRFLVT